MSTVFSVVLALVVALSCWHGGHPIALAQANEVSQNLAVPAFEIISAD